MKRIFKILILSLAVALLFTVLAVSAFAADTDNVGVAESYTVSYGDTVLTGTGYSNFKAAVRSVSENAGEKVMIKLNGDMTTVSEGITLKEGNDYYIDLAGHILASDGTLSNVMFTPSQNTNIYLYSSAQGGAVFHAYSSNGTTAKGHSVFYLKTENTVINLGEVTVDGVTYSGDNLSVYCSSVVDNSLQTTFQNAVMNVKGGSYYRTGSSAPALFMMRGTGRLNIDGALLYTISSNCIFSLNVTEDYMSRGSIHVKNSVIIGESTTSTVLHSISPNASLLIEDSYIVANMGRQNNISAAHGVKDGVPVYNRCYFSSASVFGAGNNEEVKCFDYKEIELKINQFSFSANADGTYSVDPNSFVTTSTLKKVAFVKAVAAKEDYSNITWQIPGEDPINEKWLNGSTPIAPVTLPESTAAYKYSFAGITPADGDVTYTARAYANFSVKANITLYTDFVYNVYIPTSAAQYINTVTLAGKSVDLSKQPTVNALGETYYHLSYDIFASRGSDSYQLVLNVDGYSETFDQVYTLSIPSYSKYILDGQYDSGSKNLMNTVLAYIRSAVAFSGGDTSEIDQIGNITDASAPTNVNPAASAPQEFKNIFANAQLSIGSSVNFRFNVRDGVTSGTAIFSYPVNGVYESFTVTEDDWIEGDNGKYYYEVTLRAWDLGKSINVTVGESTYSYSLENYVYYVNNSLDENTYKSIITIVNNLWAYSKASAGYTYTTLSVDITVVGEPISAYEIVASTSAEKAAANILKSALDSKLGADIPIVSSPTGTCKIINIDLVTGVEQRDSDNDFAVYEDGGNLYVKCEYTSFLTAAMTDFVKDYVASINYDYDFSEGFVAVYNTDKIYYSDFGAKGDAVLTKGSDNLYSAIGTDDFVAIKAAHASENNIRRHVVCADPGKTFYICDTAPSGTTVEKIVIKTDTVWDGATIVIDDTNLHQTDSINRSTGYIFVVDSDYPVKTLDYTNSSQLLSSLAGIGPATTTIPLSLGYDAMLNIKNSSHKVYIRFGGNENSGSAQHELVVIDKDGNIQKGTELLLDYEMVSEIDVYKIETTPLTVEGGTVITLASRRDTTVDNADGTTTKYSAYFNRGMQVERSNVTLRGIEHKVYNEFTTTEQAAGYTGPSYHGFFSASGATNITFENLIMCARRYYKINGTYGFSSTLVNNIVLKNCTQSNFYLEDGKTLSTSGSVYWGLGGTNFCKNMIYDGCMLTRFDAHAGLYNGKILNSTVAMINLIGGGNMLIENTRIIDSEILTLRTDYGATWKGEITIRDCVLDTSSSTPCLIAMVWSNHYFGYTCYFPNLVIDNLKLRDGNNSTVRLVTTTWNYSVNTDSGENLDYENQYGNVKDNIHLSILEKHTDLDGNVTYNVENKNPMVPPEYITIFDNKHGITYDLMTDLPFFANTKIKYCNGVYHENDSPFIDFELR